MEKSIDGIVVKTLRVIPDERGWLMEILRCDDPQFREFGQVYLSTAYPNVVKAWHYHKIQTDNFTCVKGMMKVALYDAREKSSTRYRIMELFIGEKNPALITVPPGVYHGFKAIGTETAFFISIPSHPYNYKEPDEYRLPPDTTEIPYDWGLAPGLKHGRFFGVSMKLLITGGAGFIGSNFIRHIMKTHPNAEIVNLDALTYAGNPNSLKDVNNDPRYTFVKGNICNSEKVNTILKNHEIDTLVHFAAESHVDRSITDASVFVKTNVLGTHTLLEAARRHAIRNFIHISTDEVYGSTLNGSFQETDTLNPSSPYSSSKAGSDLLALSYFTTYNLPVIVTRCTNNFGPYQYPEKLISLFVTNLIDGKKVPVYGTGKNIRDWIHVNDHCRAVDFLLHKGKAGEIYNIGGGSERTNLEITEKILELLCKDESMIEYVTDRPGHDFRYSLDCSKLRALGWKASQSFEEGLSDTVNWYIQNEWWWRPLKK